MPIPTTNADLCAQSACSDRSEQFPAVKEGLGAKQTIAEFGGIVKRDLSLAKSPKYLFLPKALSEWGKLFVIFCYSLNITFARGVEISSFGGAGPSWGKLQPACFVCSPSNRSKRGFSLLPDPRPNDSSVLLQEVAWPKLDSSSRSAWVGSHTYANQGCPYHTPSGFLGVKIKRTYSEANSARTLRTYLESCFPRGRSKSACQVIN